ncbi:uncharacterized protein LOC108251756 [Kryptolebias marmoratus]|uniref:uncharacterized protein LOC108251756 n=1 Tax=Kryptolebias marmoratus TaxID=37003 RepID=UPI0007F92760|nr:uncharacterized protein LOC108251756 [Kryptolebias marmoratus]
MDQRQAGSGEYRRVVVGMNSDESVLLLIKHCRDMKQQEVLLRTVTLLLLLSCTAVFLFTSWAAFRPCTESAAEQKVAYLKEEKLCPAEKSGNERGHLHNIQLSGNLDTLADGSYSSWNSETDIGDKRLYNRDNHSIVIPVEGTYFVSLRFTLSCPAAEPYQLFHVKLQRLPEGYNMYVNLTEVWDGLDCELQQFRTVFVGQLFKLHKGDRLSVWMEKGSKLIYKSWLGLSLR